MIRSMRRIVIARGASSMLALTLLLGGCGGGEEDATGRAAPAQAAPEVQAAAADRAAQAEAVDLRSAPGPSKRRKARSRDWNGVTALVAARGGDVIGAADNKGRVRVLDAADTRVRTTVAGHRGASVTGVVFSADGRSLISVGRDSVAEVWSVADGKRTLTLSGHEHPVRAVAASGGGDLIATGGEETRVMLWNARTGRLQNVLYGASDFVNSVAFSPDGRLLAAGDAAARVYLWDTKTGALRATLLGHAGEVNAVAFSPDGKLLASASDDMRVLTWNVARPILNLSFAVDRIVFRQPVQVGDVVCCYTEILRTGNSSITLSIEVWAMRQGQGDRLKVTDATFTFVAVDDDGRPRPLRSMQ